MAMKLQNLVEPLGYFGFLLAINVIFLVVGTFMDQNPVILILAPIATNLGIEPIHFGVVVITNLVIGLIPPLWVKCCL
jgi:C4-dicarboxylate transporter, DctM subunit